MLEINKIYLGDCLELMPQIDDKSIELVVTSPPYDDLRNYNGYVFDFKNIAKELFRVIKNGGVLVWVVKDHIISWSNVDDLILDPMCGSGTTCKMAKLSDRNYIGIDISQEYVDIANKRLENTFKQEALI